MPLPAAAEVERRVDDRRAAAEVEAEQHGLPLSFRAVFQVPGLFDSRKAPVNRMIGRKPPHRPVREELREYPERGFGESRIAAARFRPQEPACPKMVAQLPCFLVREFESHVSGYVQNRHLVRVPGQVLELHLRVRVLHVQALPRAQQKRSQAGGVGFPVEERVPLALDHEFPGHAVPYSADEHRRRRRPLLLSAPQRRRGKGKGRKGFSRLAAVRRSPLGAEIPEEHAWNRQKDGDCRQDSEGPLHRCSLILIRPKKASITGESILSGRRPEFISLYNSWPSDVLHILQRTSRTKSGFQAVRVSVIPAKAGIQARTRKSPWEPPDESRCREAAMLTEKPRSFLDSVHPSSSSRSALVRLRIRLLSSLMIASARSRLLFCSSRTFSSTVSFAIIL